MLLVFSFQFDKKFLAKAVFSSLILNVNLLVFLICFSYEFLSYISFS